MFGFICAQAEQESANISLRVKSKWEADGAAGKRHGGRCPFGYASSGEIIEAEAEVLREVRDRVFSGETLSKITNDWRHEASSPPDRRTRPQRRSG